ncbi:MAG: cyclase family protein [Duodenibacillus sp.]
MRVIDLTHRITASMPVYPGTPPVRLKTACTYEADGFRETLLSMSSHTGTHMDAPGHLFADRTTLDAMPAEQFIGKALVIDCRHLRAGDAITHACLAPYGDKVSQADFLLFNTGWDAYWGQETYFGDYPCLDEAVLNFVIAGTYKGIGFDVIGLDPIADTNLTRHKKLFAARDIVNIENLTHLDHCGRELFNFSALPLALADADGAPVRAVAWWPD